MTKIIDEDDDFLLKFKIKHPELYEDLKAYLDGKLGSKPDEIDEYLQSFCDEDAQKIKELHLKSLQNPPLKSHWEKAGYIEFEAEGDE